MKKGFTMIELVVVVVIIGILAAISVPMYTEYVKRSKAAEVPFNLKVIAQAQLALKEDPALGRFATEIETLKWTTQNATTAGRFYQFGTSGVEDCDPGTFDDPLPIGLAEAWAIQPDEVLAEWRSICMDINLNLSLNSL